MRYINRRFTYLLTWWQPVYNAERAAA